MYRLTVVSPQFDGKTLVQQHRYVNNCVVFSPGRQVYGCTSCLPSVSRCVVLELFPVVRLVLKALDVDIKHMHGYMLKTHSEAQWRSLQEGAEAAAKLVPGKYQKKKDE